MPRGWLVVHAKTQGTVARTQEPEVVASLGDVLDARPGHDVIALFAPIGLLDEKVRGGRRCERAARALLGPTRSRSVITAPIRAALENPRYRHVAELNAAIQPYMQRTVYEVHPELTFFHLNGERPTEHAASTPEGRAERRELLGDRLAGLDRLFESKLAGVDPTRVVNAAAALWTARRVFARAGVRLPLEPEWDSRGLQMALTY